MKFASGEGLKGYKFTVRPASAQVLLGPGGAPTAVQVKPLRAVFDQDNGHGFDSVIAQKKYRWTDAEREEVEKALLDTDLNPYLNSRNARRTIYCLEEMEKTRDTDADLLTRHENAVCDSFDIVGDQPVACTNQAVPGTKKCEIHTPPSGV